MTQRPHPKRYDRAYFDGWYRDSGHALGSQAALERNVALAVAATECILPGPIESVLDVGCGEGRWQPVLRRLRPDASYLGIDPSDYAVRRFGGRRNLRHGSFEELDLHVFEEPFDLVVCADVLHYLSEARIRSGLDALVENTGGVALLEVFTSADEIHGDDVDLHLRAPGWYRRLFREAGLRAVGLQMYVPANVAVDLEALDLPGEPAAPQTNFGVTL